MLIWEIKSLTVIVYYDKKNTFIITVDKYEISMAKRKRQRETGKRKHDAEAKRKTRSSQQHEEEPPVTCSKADIDPSEMVNSILEIWIIYEKYDQ